MNKINFITPFSRKPAGGIRVVNDLCTQISTVFDCGIWPSYNGKVKSGSTNYDQQASLNENAHWIITEFQLPYLHRTNKIQNCYSIFVQNPYILFHLKRFSKQRILGNLKHAKYIFCISHDAEAVIKSLLPSAKTVKLKWSLDNLFTSKVQTIEKVLASKERLITYMPRKCRPVYELLKNHKEISGYKLAPLENLDFSALLDNMAKSSIHISLCEYEGFAAPPLEAYALGNIVIGYAGNGNEKLFEYRNFHKVEQNNYNGLLKKIYDVINKKEKFQIDEYYALMKKFSNEHVTEFNISQFAKSNFSETCTIKDNFNYPTTKFGYFIDSVATKIYQM